MLKNNHCSAIVVITTDTIGKLPFRNQAFIAVVRTIQAEESDYVNYPIPKFYHFKSHDARERILYANFNQVERDVKNMVAAIFEKEKAKNPQDSVKTVRDGK